MHSSLTSKLVQYNRIQTTHEITRNRRWLTFVHFGFGSLLRFSSPGLIANTTRGIEFSLKPIVVAVACTFFLHLRSVFVLSLISVWLFLFYCQHFRNIGKCFQFKDKLFCFEREKVFSTQIKWIKRDILSLNKVLNSDKDSIIIFNRLETFPIFSAINSEKEIIKPNKIKFIIKSDDERKAC